jgi:hypothetical protein
MTTMSSGAPPLRPRGCRGRGRRGDAPDDADGAPPPPSQRGHRGTVAPTIGIRRRRLRTNVTIGGASEASSAGAAASASASDAVDGRHCDGRTDRRSAGEDGEVSGERERREGGRAGNSW